MTYAPFLILYKLFLERMPLNLGSLFKYLVISTLLKEWNETNFLLSIHPLPVVQSFLQLIPFTTKEITGHIIEEAKDGNIAPRNPPSSFFVHVLLFQ